MKTWKSLFLIFFVLAVTLTCAAAKEELSVSISITLPTNNAEVGHTEVVQGKVSDPKANVFVLVHPLLTNLWWVQRIPTAPNKDGSWRTLCYFGTPEKGRGEQFEIAAVVTRKKLSEGQVLSEIPKEAARSDIVVVKRVR